VLVAKHLEIHQAGDDDQGQQSHQPAADTGSNEEQSLLAPVVFQF
jgi:hypothetical protein